MNRSAYVIATSQFIVQDIDDKQLRLNLKQYGVDARRLSRFSQLALLGALPLQAQIQTDTNIYLGASFNSPSKFNKTFVQLMQQQVPSPLDFMANLNNATTFHLSQQFKTQASSIFLAIDRYNYAQPIELALLDLQTTEKATVLVGWVCEKTELMKLEGSYWWLITNVVGKKQQSITLEQAITENIEQIKQLLSPNIIYSR